MSSIDRVMALLDGRTPDRQPTFDLLRNDAAIEHFGGEQINFENAPRLVPRAIGRALDGTRPQIRLPVPEGRVIRPDGRGELRRRWTIWVDPVPIKSTADCLEWIEQAADQIEQETESDLERQVQDAVQAFLRDQAALGDCYLVGAFWGGPGLMGLHTSLGLEWFCEALIEAEGTVQRYLDARTQQVLRRIAALPIPPGLGSVFVGEDIAFGVVTGIAR